jgi:thiol-activated cytolysin
MEHCDIGVVDSVTNRTFPGSLLLLNGNLLDNNPDVLVTDRKPMKFWIDLPGMGNDAAFTVDDPSYINVSTGIDNALKKYNKQAIPAKIEFMGSMVYSESQLNATFGLDMKSVSKQLNINFDSVFKKKSTVYIASFRQIFYTVSCDMPKNPSDVFADSVDWSTLAGKGVSNSNPPGIVNKVGYGRSIYVKIESHDQSSYVEAALKAAINESCKTTAEAKYRDILSKCEFSAVIMGGSVKHIEIISCKNIDDVIKIIKAYPEYSVDNPGYPVYYNVLFLQNNKKAKTVDMVKYIQTTSEVRKGGIIKLNHTGGYVGQFRVTWTEISYDANGQKQTASRSWGRNDKDLTAPYSTEISLSGNCTDINVKAWACTGLAWDWWRVIFNSVGLPLVPERNYSIYGTSLHAKYSITP